MKLVTTLAAALVAMAIATTVAFGAAGTKAATLPEIDVSMTGAAISVTGTLESGAVNIHTTATGTKSGAPLFVRLNPGVSAAQFYTWLQSKNSNDPNNVAPFGSIVLDAVAGPGTNDIQTILEPGDYVAFDDFRNNPANWPTTTFTVTTNATPATLPAVTQWQKSIEFAFRGTTTLHTGQLIRVTNAGWVVHMIDMIGVKDPANGHELGQLLRSGAGSNADFARLSNGQSVSLLGPASHGAVQQFVLKAKPGWYVEACFMDTQDHREHTRLGMERLIHIVK